MSLDADEERASNAFDDSNASRASHLDRLTRVSGKNLADDLADALVRAKTVVLLHPGPSARSRERELALVDRRVSSHECFRERRRELRSSAPFTSRAEVPVLRSTLECSTQLERRTNARDAGAACARLESWKYDEGGRRAQSRRCRARRHVA